MRRSGSASCILRPKHSLSQEDLHRLATDAPTTTVLTVDKLPSYCTDRLYLLSELQVHAHSIHFLCDSYDGITVGGVGSTSGSSSDLINANSARSANNNNNNNRDRTVPAYPPSIILYLLWKPNTYPTPQSFADGPLTECVRQCLFANGDEAPTQEELEAERSNNGSPRSSPYSPRRRLMMLNDPRGSPPKCDPPPFMEATKDSAGGEETSVKFDSNSRESSPTKSQQPKKKKEQLTRIYVVVDLIPSSDTNDSFNELPNLPDLTHEENNNHEEAGMEQEEGVEIQPIRNEPSQTAGQGTTTPTKREDGGGATTNNQQTKQQKIQPPRSPTKEEKEHRLHTSHASSIATAEQLARAVASSRFLRTRIDGISVGITSDARAAPGLEACMDAVERGAKERRVAGRDRGVRNLRREQQKKKRKQQQEQQQEQQQQKELQQKQVTGDDNDDFFSSSSTQEDENMQQFQRKTKSLERLRDNSPERSPIAIVAMQPDDLEMVDGHHDHSHHHHHAYESEEEINSKILQCRVSTEWNGKGEYKTFSDRAMKHWREAWYGGSGFATGGSSSSSSGGIGTESGVTNNERSSRKPKVPRISKRGNRDDYDEEETYDYADEPISTAMVIVFLAVMAAYVWNSYGDFIRELLNAI